MPTKGVHPTRSKSRQKNVIIFDGDDTLWLTQRHYDETINRFLDFLASLGFRKRAAKTLFDQIELQNAVELGVSRTRFPKSMADTYGVLSEKHGRKKKSGITAQLRTIGRDVFSALPKLRPETRAVLNDLSREYTLVLLTAGNPILQRRKIRNLRLGHYFNLVVITPKKTAPLLRGILRELGARPENAMMVGNSVRSDIIPAAEAGITPVQVIARGWQYDRVKGYNAKHRKIRTLLQLPEIAINVFGPHNVK